MCAGKCLGRLLTGRELRVAAQLKLKVRYVERYFDGTSAYDKVVVMEPAKAGYYIGCSDIEPDLFGDDDLVYGEGDWGIFGVYAVPGVDYATQGEEQIMDCTCPKCGKDLRMMVDVTMIIPATMESRLTKRALQQKGVELYAANWPRQCKLCPNCGWSISASVDTLTKTVIDCLDIAKTQNILLCEEIKETIAMLSKSQKDGKAMQVAAKKLKTAISTHRPDVNTNAVSELQKENIALKEVLAMFLDGADCSDWGEQSNEVGVTPTTHLHGQKCPVCLAKRLLGKDIR